MYELSLYGFHYFDQLVYLNEADCRVPLSTTVNSADLRAYFDGGWPGIPLVLYRTVQHLVRVSQWRDNATKKLYDSVAVVPLAGLCAAWLVRLVESYQL